MTPTVEKLRSPGQQLYFEYHCWESPESSDAELWHRSHQRVTVLDLAPNDSCWPAGGILATDGFEYESVRADAGQPICYQIQFADGLVGIATEDELLDSPAEYYRPDPPLE